MAFPQNAVLDDFNRADNPVGSNWTILGTANLKVSANALVATDGTNGIGYWNPSTFGPDSEVFATIAAGTNLLWLFLRWVDLSSFATSDGYALIWGSSSFIIYRIDNGTATQLGADFGTVALAGDQIGMSATGATLTCYVNGTTIGTRTDSTYSAAGNIGVRLQLGSGIDDFGGGTFVVPPPINEKPWRRYPKFTILNKNA